MIAQAAKVLAGIEHVHTVEGAVGKAVDGTRLTGKDERAGLLVAESGIGEMGEPIPILLCEEMVKEAGDHKTVALPV